MIIVLTDQLQQAVRVSNINNSVTCLQLQLVEKLSRVVFDIITLHARFQDIDLLTEFNFFVGPQAYFT